MPLLESGAGHPATVRMAVAACAAHRLEVLRERQLRGRFGCPLLTLDDDAAAEERHDTRCGRLPQNETLGSAGVAVHNLFLSCWQNFEWLGRVTGAWKRSSRIYKGK